MDWENISGRKSDSHTHIHTSTGTFLVNIIVSFFNNYQDNMVIWFGRDNRIMKCSYQDMPEGQQQKV